ncbi:MAG: hypothetical protein ACI8QS_003492, partial [Planctomycetota bacterium]
MAGVDPQVLDYVANLVVLQQAVVDRMAFFLAVD